MALTQPVPSRDILARRDSILRSLVGLLGRTRVIDEEAGRRVYARDSFAWHAALPLAVVFPNSPRQVSQLLRYCYETGLKVHPRGGGSSLVAGAVGSEDGIVVCLSQMAEILDINPFDRLVRVEAGATIGDVCAAVAGEGLTFAPDPTSRQLASVGGMIATNALGAGDRHRANTAEHIAGLKLVLIDGDIIEIGGKGLDRDGLDLAGLVCGSEGLLGIVAEATLRLVPIDQAAGIVWAGFGTIASAMAAAESVLTGNLPPFAAEIVDRTVADAGAGDQLDELPAGAEYFIVFDFRGTENLCRLAIERSVEIIARHEPIAVAHTLEPDEIGRIWNGLQGGPMTLGRFGPIACLSVSLAPQRFSDAISRARSIAAAHDLGVAASGHLATGVLDFTFNDDRRRTEHLTVFEAVIGQTLEAVIDIGGRLAGSHGIGAAKRAQIGYQLSQSDLDVQMRLKAAFDAEWLLNKGKVLPVDTL